MAEFKEQEPRPLSEVGSKETFTNKSSTKSEKLEGGRADNRPDSDFDPEQLKIGIKIESEHTTDPAAAKEVAKDHLSEIPDYYKRLTVMEAKAASETKKSLERANDLIKAMKVKNEIVKSMKESIDEDDEDDIDIKKKMLKPTNVSTKKVETQSMSPSGHGSSSSTMTTIATPKNVSKSLSYFNDLIKALKAADIAGLSRRARQGLAYQAGLVAGRNSYFDVEPIDLTGKLNVGIDEAHLRPDYEPPVVPVRTIDTPFEIAPKKCGDHTYTTTKAGNEEAKPFWSR